MFRPLVPGPGRPASWIAPLLGLILATGAQAAVVPGFEYVSPVPGSDLLSRQTNIILRPGTPLTPANVASFRVEVSGGISGPHPGRLELSDDGRTLLFQPDEAFAPGEEVTVTVGHWPEPFDDGEAGPSGSGEPALRSGGPGEARGARTLRFTFRVSPGFPGAVPSILTDGLASEIAEAEFQSGSTLDRTDAETGGDDVAAINEYPSGFPESSLLFRFQPSPGYFFVSPFTPVASDPGHLLILDRWAKPVFYRRLLRPATDFKLERGDRLVYFTRERPGDPVPRYSVLDRSGQELEQITAGNGYVTDSHELKLLPDGHALLMSYDPQPVRMDLVVPGGRENARVIGLVIQELDRQRRVVFQWRSWDHFEITDASSGSATLTGPTVDYVHGNSIEVTPEGDLLISSRHLSEVTKISRRTGEVIWRMSPNGRRNDFTFADDPRGFSHQHDVRLQPDGRMTLFDNGNGIFPSLSRVVEYEVDEAARTVRQTWEYRREPTIYGPFMGSYQRFASGGGLVGWGGATATAKFTELHPDGSVALEVGFPRSNMWSYRAFYGPWRTTRLLVDRTALEFATQGDGPQIQNVTITNPGPAPVTLNYFAIGGSTAFSVPVNTERVLGVGESTVVPVRFSSLYRGSFEGSAYIGFVTAGEIIAQDIVLTGTEDDPNERGPSALRRGRLEAREDGPDGASTIEFSLERPGRVRLEVFDLGGRRVGTLVDEERPAGEHRVAWQPGPVPSGVYFCRLATPEAVRVLRFARLR